LVAVACLNNKLRRNLRDALGVDDPSVDGMSYDWFSEDVRAAHKKAAEPFERAFRERTTGDVLLLLDGADVPCQRVKFPEEMYDDEHVQTNDLMLELEHPVVGRLRMPASPVRMSATPPATASPPPVLGADGPDVLRELGVPEDEIAQLLEDGVLVTRERLLEKS
jgi:crotonobetainyl-CoA:carnitine CoA-transferase CaiB-like acyl-CoA transferase